MSDLASKLSGKFIVIDGPDGGGKSTQIKLLADWLREGGLDVLTTRDPGGTAIGDRIREILLDPAAAEMAVTCEMLLYMASRAQLVAEVIRPALAEGKCVICDRFVSATLAYQVAGGAEAEGILAAAKVAVGDTWPALTIILDIDAEHGLARVKRGLDRMEAKGVEFHGRVRQAFLDQAQSQPERFAVVDAVGEVEQVHQRVRAVMTECQ